MNRRDPFGWDAMVVTALAVAVMTWIICAGWRSLTTETDRERIHRVTQQYLTGREIPPPRTPWPARSPIGSAIVTGTTTIIVMRGYLFVWRMEHAHEHHS